MHKTKSSDLQDASGDLNILSVQIGAQVEAIGAHLGLYELGIPDDQTLEGLLLTLKDQAEKLKTITERIDVGAWRGGRG